MYNTFNLQIDDLKVVEFYPYPSVILYQIGMYDEVWNPGCGDKNIKRLFEKVLEKANTSHNANFLDNKIAFKVIHEPTGCQFYIGVKDGIYRFGFGVKQEYDRKIIL